MSNKLTQQPPQPIEELEDCPQCKKQTAVCTHSAIGKNAGRFGEDVDVSSYQCLNCGEMWSD